MNNNYTDLLPDDLTSMIGKTIEKKLPDGRVVSFILGDITGDGKIDKDDIEILRMLIKNDSTANAILASMTPEQLASCDVTGDGKLTHNDLIELMKKILQEAKPVNNNGLDSRLNNLKNKLRG